MAITLGKDVTLCRNTSSPYSFSSPKHTPLIAARNIKAPQKPAGIFDSSDRSGQYQSGIPVRKNCEIAFDMIADGGAGFLALRDAFVNGTEIDLAYIRGQPQTSKTGLRGDWVVCKFGRKFPLAGGQLVDVLIKPARNYNNRVRIFTDAGAGTLGTAETAEDALIGFDGSVNDSTDTPIEGVQDFSWSLEWVEEEASDRAQEADGLGVAFEQYLLCNRKITAELTVLGDESDAQIVAFRTASNTNAPIELTFLDGPFADVGSWGIHADWGIDSYEEEAGLNGGVVLKMQFSPHGNGTNAFEFVTIS